MEPTDPVGVVNENFSEPGAVAPPWAEIADLLDTAEMFVLTTVRSNGRPHSVPLPAMWLDGALHFCTGDGEQKARNLAGNRAATLTTTTSDFRSGVDVVVEGDVEACTDDDVLTRLAELWKQRLDWEFEVVDGRFREPGFEQTAGVYRLAPSKVLAFTKGSPYAQVRYRPGGD